jgi:hypothetical protein
MPSIRRFGRRDREPRPDQRPETVAVVRVYATIRPGDPDDDTDEEPFEERDALLYRAALEWSDLIEAQIRASVSEHLGPEFDVEVRFERGSLELVAAIVLAGSVVMTYGAVRSGLDYVREDAGRVIRRVLRRAVPDYLETAPYVTLGPAMSKFVLAEPSNETVPGSSMIYLTVMGTLVVAALLTTLLVVVFVKVL